MIPKNKILILASRPFANPGPENFKMIESEIPVPGKGQVLIKSKFISVDPYMRGRMSEAKSYVEPYRVNEPISGDIIGEVIESKSPDFKTGDYVQGELRWQLYNISEKDHLTKLDTQIEPITTYMGVLGMPGLTAYFGLLDIGNPDSGNTIVISGAAGAVGTTAGQIAKIMGCRVIGIAGSDQKISFLKSELGFDDAINYKTVPNLRKTLKNCCPDGIDIYFDNVGGEISDSVMYLINDFSRIIICGQISQYNITRMPVGPRIQNIILVRRALMQAFIVSDYRKHYHYAKSVMKKWYLQDRLKHKETFFEGFENLPDAFFGLFRGDNIGKMIVRIE